MGQHRGWCDYQRSLRNICRAFSRSRRAAPATLGYLRPKPVQRLDHLGGNDEAGEPLVVRGHDMPRRFRPAGVADHVLVGGHVLVPELSLRDVAHRELPVFRWLFDALQEPPFLLFLGDVQKEFQDQRPVAREIALERPDILEPFLPDVLGHQLGGHFLFFEKARMHAHDQHFLIIGAVENPDPAALGKSAGGAPHEVVIQVLPDLVA